MQASGAQRPGELLRPAAPLPLADWRLGRVLCSSRGKTRQGTGLIYSLRGGIGAQCPKREPLIRSRGRLDGQSPQPPLGRGSETVTGPTRLGTALEGGRTGGRHSLPRAGFTFSTWISTLRTVRRKETISGRRFKKLILGKH